jgi:hypothetical protein
MVTRPAALAAIALGLLTPMGAVAHDGAFAFGAFGTAAVDGVLAPGEWDDASTLAFTANAPGGGTVPGELSVMNDGEHLYLGVRVATTTPTLSVSFGFDNDHDGIWPEEGSDGLALGFGVRNGFGDLVLSARGGCPAGSLCGFHDVDLGGSVDATGLRTVHGGETQLELAKTLDSADDLNDFSLSAGDVVGVGFQIALCDGTQCVLTQPVPFVVGDIEIVREPTAIERLADLAAAVEGVGPGMSLDAKVATARAALDRGDVSGTLGLLAALLHELAAQSGKSISPATAAALAEEVAEIVRQLSG